VVVAVLVVGTMQVSIHEIINMVAVGHAGMTAIAGMGVCLCRSFAAGGWSAAGGIVLVDAQGMLVDVSVVNMMHMIVM
jgi:hypothetical protein